MQTVPCQALSLPLTLSVFNNFFDFSAISCCVFIPPGHVPLTFSVFLTWSHYHSLALVGYSSLLLFPSSLCFFLQNTSQDYWKGGVTSHIVQGQQNTHTHTHVCVFHPEWTVAHWHILKIQIFFWCICFIITVNMFFCCFLMSRLTQQSDQHLPTEQVTMCTCKHKVTQSLIATFYIFEMWL